MIKSRSLLMHALREFDTGYPVEKTFVQQFVDLLQEDACYLRHHLPGHITGSSFIIDHSREYALLTHHAKLNKWLQPGGHADGDEDIMAVALREAQEETGLSSFVLLKNGLFDIDIHTIPERKDFPEHLHYDVRFLFEASKTEALTITEESHDLAWVPLSEVGDLTNQHPAMMRMIDKLKLL